MEHFWKTVEVIPEGIGFAHYGTLHLCWLAAFAVLLVLNCILYRRLDGKGRKLWRILVAVLLVLDEVYKQIPLFVKDCLLWNICRCTFAVSISSLLPSMPSSPQRP